MMVSAQTASARRVADRLELARSELRTSVRRRFLASLDRLSTRAVQVYQQPGMTPVRTGALMRSTESHIVLHGGASASEAIAALDASIEVRQPATNRSGQEYMAFVVRKHGTYAGNLYPQRANAVLAPELAAAQHDTGHGAMIDAVAVMRGGIAGALEEAA